MTSMSYKMARGHFMSRGILRALQAVPRLVLCTHHMVPLGGLAELPSILFCVLLGSGDVAF